MKILSFVTSTDAATLVVCLCGCLSFQLVEVGTKDDNCC